MNWNQVDQALEDGVNSGISTAASLLVGQSGRVLHLHICGHHSDQPNVGPVTDKSIYDLASLTKPLATTLACLGLVELDLMSIDDPASKWLNLPNDKKTITIKHLLTHTSGLPAWRPYHQELSSLPYVERHDALIGLLTNEPLEYPTGVKTIYSDLGFMMLQLIVEKITRSSLAEYVIMNYCQPLGIHDLGFVILPDGPGPVSQRFVATEHCPLRGKLLQGEVNDENAWAMGGIAGQAGLFGSISAVFELMQWLVDSARGAAVPRMLSPEVARLIFHRPIEGQPRTIGFDLPTGDRPAMGRLAQSEVIGHLGFTGTSLWHRKSDDLTVILLTNRTIFGRDNDKIKEFRPYIHDLVADALDM